MKVQVDKVVDAKGLGCPMPVVRAKKAMDELSSGEVMEVISTDKGSLSDFKAWVKRGNHELLDVEEQGEEYHFFVKKS